MRVRRLAVPEESDLSASIMRESSPPDAMRAQRPEILARVRRDDELRRVDTAGGPRRLGQRDRVEANQELRATHGEFAEHRFEGRGELRSRLPPPAGEIAGRLHVAVTGSVQRDL